MAIYYLALHGKSNASAFCGIDINAKQSEEQILKGLWNLLESNMICPKAFLEPITEV